MHNTLYVMCISCPLQSDVQYRFSGAHNHRFVLDFIQRVGECYATDRLSLCFVLAILGLNVPKLFNLPETTDKGYSTAVEVRSEVSTFVQNYVRRNLLRTNLLQKMNEILVGIQPSGVICTRTYIHTG